MTVDRCNACLVARAQCCPFGEGAAVIVASEKALQDLGVNRSRSMRVTASVSCSENNTEKAAMLPEKDNMAK